MLGSQQLLEMQSNVGINKQAVVGDDVGNDLAD
jgi:hypothetical protein